MEDTLKYKIGTTKPIDEKDVLKFFEVYIDHSIDIPEKGKYVCIDQSVLVLKLSGLEDNVYVEFHLNFEIDSTTQSLGFSGKDWFMKFCNAYNSEIKNLRTKVIMPVSDGAIMSDIRSSEAFKQAKHRAFHPKDSKRNNRK